MPLGKFEREILRTIAANRHPDSYIGGATVLHQSPESTRSSRDIDIFHDSAEALEFAVTSDSATLRQAGCTLDVKQAYPGFVRATVRRHEDRTKLEWVFDSAFRFFPVEPDPDLGFRLNFWDAATNKVLAASGRAEVRDYVDLLDLHTHHLSLGALIWAAAGKDDGLTPSFIIGELSRVQRYPAEAYAELRTTTPFDPVAMKRKWLAALDQARSLFDTTLESAPVGCLFLNSDQEPVTPTSETLSSLTTHFGSVRGCLPRIDNS